MTQYARKFGHLTPKNIPSAQDARYLDNQMFRSELETVKKVSGTERAITWCSYFTMVYAAIIAFAPQTASAAVKTISLLIN